MIKITNLYLFNYKDKLNCLNISASDSFFCEEIDKIIIENIKHTDDEILKKIESKNEHVIKKIKIIKEELSRNLIERDFDKVDLKTPIYTLIIHPSRNCNLACKYCFGNHENISKEEITLKMAKKAIDSMVYRFAADRKKYIVDLSGSGEPLLKFDFIKEIYNYCREVSKKIEKEILIMFATNGTLLDEEKIEFLNNPGILYGLSIDGYKELNDSLRIYKNGKGTYNDIVSSGKQINNSKRIGLAVTLTGKHNNVKEIFKDLYDLKIANSISMKPVRGEIGTEYSIDESNIKDIKKGYEELTDFLLEETLKGNKEYIYSNIRGADYFGKFIKRILSRQRIVRRCDAGLSRASVNYKGELYSCQVKIDDKAFLIGDIFNGISNEKYKELSKLLVENIEECKQCWAKYLCGGECFALAKDLNNTMTKPDKIMCELKQHMIKLAIYLVNTIKETRPDFYNELSGFLFRQNVYNGTDSGAYTLNKLTKYYGKETSIDRIRELGEIDERGIKPFNLLNVAKTIGIEVKAIRAKKENLLNNEIKFPAIAYYSGGLGKVANYYSLITDVKENMVKVDDALHGEIEYSIDEFCNLWSGITFIV